MVSGGQCPKSRASPGRALCTQLRATKRCANKVKTCATPSDAPKRTVLGGLLVPRTKTVTLRMGLICIALEMWMRMWGV